MNCEGRTFRGINTTRLFISENLKGRDKLRKAQMCVGGVSIREVDVFCKLLAWLRTNILSTNYMNMLL